MNTQISKNLRCVVMRNGIEIWLESERVITLQNILEKITGSKFINFDDRTINTADITGIFTPQDMEEHTHRKNGGWKCGSNIWHDKAEKCNCLSVQEKEHFRLREEAIKNCQKCSNGFLFENRIARVCECIKYI